jgi:CheY-like chemotaxis protein
MRVRRPSPRPRRYAQETVRLSILVASPDPDAREIFCAALEYAGFETRVLSQPDRLLDEAAGCAVVITDHPNVVGQDRTLTRLLRDHPPTARIPILNATTHALPQELQDASADGVTETVILPVPIEQVVEMVRGLAGTRHEP